MSGFIKSCVVNLSGAVAAFALCWAVLAVFDANTGRAGVYSACFGFGILAAGLYMWPYDRDFLDTTKLVVALMALSAIAGVLLLWDIAANAHGAWTLTGLAAFLRSGSGGWQRLLSCMIFFFFVPFLFASAIRSALIGVMVNGFGARKFGLAAANEIERRRARELTPGVSFVANELGAIVMIALFWPGVWALVQIHNGQMGKGALAILIWLVALSALCLWFHRRQLISLWVSASALFAVMGAALWVIWN